MCNKKRKKDNSGFSLIELIVSLLIASILVIAIGGFLSVGTSVFHHSNTETQLQKESQIAMNQLDDILLKAVDYHYYDDIQVEGVNVGVLLIKTDREEATVNNHYYAIIVDTIHRQLLFQKITDVELASLEAPRNTEHGWAESIAEEQITNTSEPSLLAKYVDSISVVPKEYDADQAVVQITIHLSLHEKTFSTFSSIKLRNN